MSDRVPPLTATDINILWKQAHALKGSDPIMQRVMAYAIQQSQSVSANMRSETDEHVVEVLLPTLNMMRPDDKKYTAEQCRVVRWYGLRAYETVGKRDSVVYRGGVDDDYVCQVKVGPSDNESDEDDDMEDENE